MTLVNEIAAVFAGERGNPRDDVIALALLDVVQADPSVKLPEPLKRLLGSFALRAELPAAGDPTAAIAAYLTRHPLNAGYVQRLQAVLRAHAARGDDRSAPTTKAKAPR